MNVLLTSDERCTYSSSLTPSFINETSPKAKKLNLGKISCQGVIYLKNVDLLSTMTVLQILPRVNYGYYRYYYYYYYYYYHYY